VLKFNDCYLHNPLPSGFMRLCNITEKGRMVAQSGIITAMCNRYSVDITPVTHVISQGCNIHAHDIPVGTVILHPVPYTVAPVEEHGED